MPDQYTQLPLVSTEPMKRCTKCREVKPVTAFSRDPQHASGYDAYCKTCRVAMRLTPEIQRRRDERAAKYAAIDALNAQGLKRCNKCERVKPLAGFYASPATHDRLAPTCKACRKPADSAYRATVHESNPDHYATYQRAYYEANRERLLAQNAAYIKEHAEQVAATQLAWSRRYRQSHREESNAKARAYRRAHPERQAAYDARRRARLKNAPVNDFTLQQWEEMKERYEHRCAYCGTRPDALTQDHVLPLSRGGSHTASNIVPACLSCNSRKQTRTPEEWDGPYGPGFAEPANPP